LYHQYYNAGQYTAADDALGASNGFRLEKEKLSTEKENWGKFLSAVNGAANATARFTGGSTQTDYSGTLSALAARYYAAYLDASVTPTWDNLPTAAKNHTFIIGLLYGGNPQLLLMFNTKAGAVRDSGIANVLCKGFYFAATYFADLLPRLTVKVDGTEWVQGAQESWTGVTTNNSFSMDTVHHVDLYMSASLIDSNYAPAWGQRIRTDMKLFSFDFKIKEE
jgi:hypothetical protein